MNAVRLASVSRCRVNALLVATGLLLACAPPSFALDLGVGGLFQTQGSGNAVTQRREVSEFSGVDLQTSTRVEIRQGERDAVEIQADDNVAPLIETEVREHTLHVTDAKRYQSSIARIVVTVRRLDRIAAGGVCKVTSDALIAPSLAIALGGASALQLNKVTAERIAAELGGTSALNMTGIVNDLALQLGGVANVKAGALNARRVTIDGGGAAQAVVTATESLAASLGGAAGVSYYGHPKTTFATGGAATTKALGEPPAH